MNMIHWYLQLLSDVVDEVLLRGELIQEFLGHHMQCSLLGVGLLGLVAFHDDFDV